MVAFFIPKVPEDRHEEVYVELAREAGCAPQPTGQRIRSINFTHNGEHWVATVGEQLRGTAFRSRGRGRDRRELEVPLRNDSTIMAIFPGSPYLVWHDGASHSWVNPFMAGVPTFISYFD